LFSYAQGAIAEAGGIRALVDLVFKWPSGGEGVLVIFEATNFNFQNLTRKTIELRMLCFM